MLSYVREMGDILYIELPRLTVAVRKEDMKTFADMRFPPWRDQMVRQMDNMLNKIFKELEDEYNPVDFEKVEE